MQVIGKTGRVINLPDQLAKKLIEKNRVKEAFEKEGKKKEQSPKQKEGKKKNTEK